MPGWSPEPAAGADPLVELPPVEVAEVDSHPVEEPPPAEEPWIEPPPVQQPPVEEPPIDDPPVEMPDEEPPVDEPPTEERMEAQLPPASVTDIVDDLLAPYRDRSARIEEATVVEEPSASDLERRTRT